MRTLIAILLSIILLLSWKLPLQAESLGKGSSAPTIDLLHTFNPPSEMRGDFFGHSMAIAGDSLFIGAQLADVPVSNSGLVAQYRLPGPTHVRTIQNPSPTSGDEFGTNIDTNGVIVAIGSRLDDTHGNNSGLVYLFEIDSGELIRTFHSPNPTENGLFGGQIRFVGETLFVSASGDESSNGPSVAAGAVYAFEIASGQILQTFENPEPDAGDSFGFNFSVKDSLLLTSARLDDTLGPDTGSAYLFDIATGELIHTFRNPTPRPADERFGTGVCLVDGKAILGALNDNTHGTEAGACYVFDVETGELERTLYSPSPHRGGQFGAVVAGVGRFIVVGEPCAGLISNTRGHAYLFDPLTGEFIEELQSPNPFTRDRFGNPSTSDGDSILVGAWGGNGAAYLYDASLLDAPTAPLVDVQPDDPTTSDDLVCSATGSVDPHGQEVSYSFEWLIDGMAVVTDGIHPVTGPSLSHVYTQKGQVAECRVTPYTATSQGRYGSDSVVILNSPPSEPVVRILPSNPIPADGLAVYLESESIDPDGDQVLYVFEWYEEDLEGNWKRRPELSGTLPPNYSPGEPEISRLYTQIGEGWRVSVSTLEVTPNETDFSSKGEGPIQGTVIWNRTSPVVDILPDFNGDRTVTAQDLLTTLGLVGQSKGSVSSSVRDDLFETSAPAEATLSPNILFKFQGTGWFGPSK